MIITTLSYLTGGAKKPDILGEMSIRSIACNPGQWESLIAVRNVTRIRRAAVPIQTLLPQIIRRTERHIGVRGITPTFGGVCRPTTKAWGCVKTRIDQDIHGVGCSKRSTPRRRHTLPQ